MSSPVEASPQDVLERLVNLGMPKWIETFLEIEFFSKCPTHGSDPGKHDVLNRYCMTCQVPACVLCIEASNHGGHRVLTIYRHVYKPVIPLDQIEGHMTCVGIQTYKCNKKWVLSLKPLPHKGSGSNIEGNRGVCIICKRKLTNADDPRFIFCSIYCKLYILLRRIYVNKTREEMRAKKAARIASTSQAAAAAAAAGSKRSRKGVPERAPKD